MWLFAVASFIVVVACFVQTVPLSRAQPKPGESYHARMATQIEYYDPPDDSKIKMKVTGREATNIPSGILIIGATIKSYSVTGALQLEAETPDCVLDTSVSPWRLSSTNLLQTRSGDGDFYVEGVGFFWNNNSSELALSNRVHTIIRQLAPGTKTNAAPAQTDVDSDRATFDTKNGLVTYRDHVLVVNPQLHLTCVFLTAQRSQGGTNNQFDVIVAETNVVIDFTDESGRKTHATADKSVYTRTNDLLTLTGNPRLETSNGWSTADIFVLNQTTRRIQGSGHCRFYSRTALASAGTAANPASTQETEITSEDFDYDMKSGLAVFSGHVRVNNPQTKLVCDTLRVKMSEGEAKGGSFDNVVAERNVIIDSTDDRGEKTHITAGKAVYSSRLGNGTTNKLLDLTGNPMLERTNGWIKADLITIDQANGIIWGNGNQHSVFKRAATAAGKTVSPAATDSEIFSDSLEFHQKTGIATYLGSVRANNPQMRLQSRRLVIKLPQGAAANSGASRPERMEAELNVIVDYLTEKGEKTHATGEDLIFTHSVTNGTTTNEVLELTGKPIIDMTATNGQVTHGTGEKLVYTSVTGSGQPSEVVRLSGHPHVETTDGIMTSDDVILYDRLTQTARSVGTENHIIYTLKDKTPAKTNAPATNASPPRLP